MAPPMKVVSVNVGCPRTAQWKGKAVSTGIFKTPISGRIALRSLNFEGGRQADLSMHGGPSKAVYVYPAEHYAYWHHEFPDIALPWGIFGENLIARSSRSGGIEGRPSRAGYNASKSPLKSTSAAFAIFRTAEGDGLAEPAPPG